MASTSETGHAKNVANFQSLIAFVNTIKDNYNPSKNALQLPQLISLKAQADENLAQVVAQNTNYNNTVNQRMQAFSGLKALSTRLVNALQTTDATDQVINEAKSFNKKIQGQRATALPKPNTPDAPVPNTISTSQQSYTQQIQHLAGLISVLENERTYNPNEEELKVETLQAKLRTLSNLNDEVANEYANVSSARRTRNTTLYSNERSIFDTAAEVKKYIKSVFGTTSPEFAQIKGLKFTKPKA